MDVHAASAAPAQNLPMLLGAFGIWNANLLGHGCRAVLPYSQALSRFAAQRLDEHSLEVSVQRGEMNELFAALSKAGITVISMRNKTNRLEQLFVSMLEDNDKKLQAERDDAQREDGKPGNASSDEKGAAA